MSLATTRVRIVAAISSGLLSAASSAQKPVAAPVQTINLQSYSYSPAPVALAAGKAVTLHFVNRSDKGHDFTASEFFAASRILEGQVHDGEVDLGPGQSASITLVPSRGTYKAHCGHPFHKMFGMKSTIYVQ